MCDAMAAPLVLHGLKGLYWRRADTFGPFCNAYHKLEICSAAQAEPCQAVRRLARRDSRAKRGHGLRFCGVFQLHFGFSPPAPFVNFKPPCKVERLPRMVKQGLAKVAFKGTKGDDVYRAAAVIYG